MGTLDYVAPEQVEGRPVDSRTDQYSLACVAFHCLTGVTPFPRDTDIAIAMAHLHDPPPSASAIRPELPADVDAVLAKAMAKRPDDRYPTSEAFALALREALGVRISEPHSIPSTATSDRRPLFIGLLAVVAVLAAVGIGLFALGSGQPAPSTSLIDRSPPASVAVSPSGGPKGDPFPTLLESSLILSLPEESAPECVRGDGALLPTRQGPSMKPRAHVVCTLLGGTWPDVVEGVLWPPTDFFNGDDVILAMAKSDGIAEGDCATQARAFGGWRGPVQTEDDGGSYLCRPAVDGGAAELIWTVESARAYYKATALDGDRIALYDWWLAYRDEISP